MPQLDKINWYYVLITLCIIISYLMLTFIKFFWYSREKINLLKQQKPLLIAVDYAPGQQNKIFYILSKLYQQRLSFFSIVNKKNQTLLHKQISDFRQNLSLRRQ